MRSTINSNNGLRSVPSTPCSSEAHPCLALVYTIGNSICCSSASRSRNELVGLVDDLADAGVGTVDLVDDQHDRQLRLERLAQHESGLGQRALAGIDEQQHAVDHGQRPLDLTAEVGVAGGVDDVDLDLAVVDRRVLGEDRDALFTLEVGRVHDSLVDVRVDPKGTGLPQHGIDEGRLAVVDVGNDRDVSDVRTLFHPPRLSA